jgi:hypothetical protein
MVCLNKYLDLKDERRIIFFTEASARGHTTNIVGEIVAQFLLFRSGLCANLVFVGGKCLKQNVIVENRTIFGRPDLYGIYGTEVRKVIQLYEVQLNSCRKAVNAWSVIARRLFVVKDVRLIIAKMIWETRSEAK